MATWEIRRIEDTPLRIEIEDPRRNLAKEYLRALRKTLQVWEISKEHVIALGSIKEVRRLEPRTRTTRQCGFHAILASREADENDPKLAE